jgi:hypothetical protein
LRIRPRLIVSVTPAIAVGLETVLAPVMPAEAAPALTITRLTWDVVGLDGNGVDVGPNNLQVGARACKQGEAPTIGVTFAFGWDTTERSVSLGPWYRRASLLLGPVALPQCLRRTHSVGLSGSPAT